MCARACHYFYPFHHLYSFQFLSTFCFLFCLVLSVTLSSFSAAFFFRPLTCVSCVVRVLNCVLYAFLSCILRSFYFSSSLLLHISFLFLFLFLLNTYSAPGSYRKFVRVELFWVKIVTDELLETSEKKRVKKYTHFRVYK